MSKNIYIYILIMAVVTYAIRALPLTLIRGKIKNRFIQSFLYYIPYVTLSVMTFPAIIYSTGSIYSGILALVTGVILAYKGVSLFGVAVSSCGVAFVVEMLIKYL